MNKEADLMSVREIDGVYELLTLIEEPGDWIEKEGRHQRIERWEPLATFIACHRIMEMPDDTYYGLERGHTLADALMAEEWTPPWESEGAAPK